jgi:uncharacterized lipoprotein YbaY
MLVMLALLVSMTTSRPAEQGQPLTPGGAIEGRVWVATDPSAPPGTLRIFLPDGTLVMTSCVETYRFVRWTRVGSSRIAWVEDTARIEATIERITASELILRLQLTGGVHTESYRAASEPFVCPSIRMAQASAVVASGTVLYMERVALPPTAQVRVELRDDSRGDAAARPLALQTLTARDGPPFKFTLSVPGDKVDARSRLSVFAEITDGGRQLFTTRNRYAVPADGVSNLDVRLTFVSSANADPPPVQVTPPPTAYQCGTETFRIAFDADRALVTMPDRSVVALPRRGGDRDSRGSRTFTDGRLTFVLAAEPVAGPRVQFARGRRALTACAVLK